MSSPRRPETFPLEDGRTARRESPDASRPLAPRTDPNAFESAQRILAACGRLALIASPRGDILWMNDAARACLGLAPAAPGAVSLRPLLTDLEAAEDAFSRAARGPIDDIPLAMRTANGESKTLVWALGPVRGADGRTGAIALLGVDERHARSVRMLAALSAVHEAEDLLAPGVDRTLLYARLADLAVETLGGSVAWIVVREELDDVTVTVDTLEDNGLRRHATRTTRSGVPGSDGSPAALVGEPLAAHNVGHDPRLPEPLRVWATEKSLTRLLAAPLKSGETQLGTIGLAVRDDAVLSDDDMARLRLFADAVAHVLRRADLLRVDYEQTLRQQRVLDIARALDAASSAAQVADLALTGAPVVTGCSRALLFLATDGGFRCAGVVSPGTPAFPAGLSLDASDVPALLEALQQTEGPLVIHDALTSRLLPTPLTQLLDMRAAIVAPLYSRGQLRGLLFADEPHAARPLAPRTAAVLGTLAQHASTALDALDLRDKLAGLQHTLEQRSAEVEAMHRISVTMHATLNLEEVLQQAVEDGRKLAGVGRCTVSLCEGTDAIALRAVSREATTPHDRIGRSFPLGVHGRTRQALVSQRQVDIADIASEPLTAEERAWMETLGIRSCLIVPLIAHGRSIGTMSFSTLTDVKLFTLREKELCDMLAKAVATAIENARLYEAERRQLRFAETVSEISRIVSTTLSLPRVLRAVGDTVVEILRADRAGIFLLDEDERRMRPEYVVGVSDQMRRTIMSRSFTVDTPVFRQLVADGSPIRVPDAKSDMRPNQDIVDEFGLNAVLLLPLVARDRVIGAVITDSAAGLTDLTDQEIALAVAICDQAALAVENARSYAETEARVRDLQALYDISGMLGSASTPQEVVSYVLHRVRDLLPSTHVQLFLTEESGTQLALRETRTARSSGAEVRDPHPAHIEDVRSCWALNRGQSFTAADTEADFRCARDAEIDADGKPPRCYACVPITTGSTTFGVLRVASDQPRAFTREHIRLTEAIAGQLGGALQRARLLDDLNARTVRDPLTEVSNHRHFMEKLANELRRATRTTSPVALLYVDVDGFKGFNDRFGHPVGDALLRTLAHVMRDAVRATDEVGRLGGDEFAIFLPNTDLAGGAVLAEKLRTRIAETRFIGSGDTPAAHATVSVGVAAYPADGLTAEDLTRAADEALYLAKAHGRNAVVMASENAEPAAGEPVPEVTPESV